MERPRKVAAAGTEQLGTSVGKAVDVVRQTGKGIKEGVRIGTAVTILLVSSALQERDRRPDHVLRSGVLRRDWKRLNKQLAWTRDPEEIKRASRSIGHINDELVKEYELGVEERRRYRKFHRDE